MAAAPSSVWARAQSAPDFIAASVQDESEAIVDRILVPGALTLLASPRGLGKTHLALVLAVALAIGGTFLGQRLPKLRVLYIDRDNPLRELRRRLRAWGAEACGANLRILTRMDAPPLTDRSWLTFPFADYDVVILDSLSSATEGVDESSGGDSGAAIAPVLDLARNGPAVLALANTDKMGLKIRGSGVLSDRADIVLECRDATNLEIDPRKDTWFESLPESGEQAWVLRAKRRTKRDSYRLALVPSKFRGAEEPDPFVVEISLKEPPWTVREVTREVEGALDGARRDAARSKEQKIADAVAALREAASMTKTAATEFLCDRGLNRTQAREQIAMLPEGTLMEGKPGRRRHTEKPLKVVDDRVLPDDPEGLVKLCGDRGVGLRIEAGELVVESNGKGWSELVDKIDQHSAEIIKIVEVNYEN